MRSSEVVGIWCGLGLAEVSPPGTFLPFVALQHHGSYRGYKRHVGDGAARPSLTRGGRDAPGERPLCA